MNSQASTAYGHELSRRALLRSAGTTALGLALYPSLGMAAVPSDPDELTSLGVGTAASWIAAGNVTAEAYVTALLNQADRVKMLDAVLSQDRNGLLQAARAVDARRRSGQPLGPLAGVPLLVKDNIDTATLPTTAATPALAGNRPQHDAAVLERLFGAGALLFGKTNMDELAMGATSTNAATGPVHNPYAPDRIAGGSSGGTAAGVAAHIVPAGLGTDTGGSARIPASLCGIIGFRPSVGRYPAAGHIPASHTRDVIAPMARNIADVALLDGVMSGLSSGRPRELRGLRLGLPKDYFWSGLDPETEAVVQDSVRRMTEAGVVFVDTDLPGLTGLLDDIAPILSYEAIVDLRAYLAQAGSKLTVEEVVADMASPGPAQFYRAFLKGGDANAYHAALEVSRPRLQALFAEAFARHSISALCFPPTPVTAPRIGQDMVTLDGKDVPVLLAYFHNCNPGSATGLPGLAMPAGLSRSGLPVGIEFDGPIGSDADLLAIGAAAEALFPPLPAPRLA